MDFTDKQQIKQFIEDNEIRDIVKLNEFLKGISGAVIEQMLEAERDEHLGYEKHHRSRVRKDNTRNGYSKKTVRSIHGESELSIPRDRDGSFSPQVVQKHQTDISELENKVLSMYAKGMTVRDIQEHVADIYGADISPQTISNITDKVMPSVTAWRNRPLEEVYAIVYIDGIRYKVRENGRVQSKCVYGVVGIDLEGHKDLLGLWIFETESANGWLKVFDDLKNRGVKDILILASDGLSGLTEAVAAAFPDTAYQGCVVHVIRNSVKYVSYKDRQAFCADLKPIYTAPTEEAALFAFDALEAAWGNKYQLAVDTWQRNLERISTMYQFSPEIRRLIYTTNPIESFNRQLRKVTKNRGVFPNDDSVLKLLYLAVEEITRKWTMKLRNWNQILAQLVIHFDRRVTNSL
jgi:transposase-like protein